MADPKSELYKQLDKIYYDPKDAGSYGGVDRLLRRARALGVRGVNVNNVSSYLTDQQAYSLHKPARKHFRRNKTITGSIDKQWQADLADMQALSRTNSGVKYILTVIDVFSKYAWAIPVKSKGSKDMVEAFKTLLNKSHPRTPQRLQTDAGKEFINKEVQALLKTHKIHHFVSASDQKAAVVERFNRTLKTRIWTYFTAQQTNQYLDVLDKVVDAYNHSFHRTIGMRPVDVKKEMEQELFERMYGDPTKLSKERYPRKLKVGQKVRISKVKGQFDKGYIPNWSEEHFLINKADVHKKRRVYKLRDYENEDMTGTWYPEELQPIDKNRYLIEKILRRRTAPSGQNEIFIKWKGWPVKFNSWIPESNIERLHKA